MTGPDRAVTRQGIQAAGDVDDRHGRAPITPVLRGDDGSQVDQRWRA